MKRLLQFLLLVLISNLSFAQQNINIVNTSSNYSNYIEYNTGEIFVVYNFGTNQVTSKITDDNSLSDASAKIKIFPNPTVSLIYYALPTDFSFEKVELYDQYQKIIFSSTENTKQISLENLPSGIYYIMFNNNKQHNYKIIKN